MSYRICQPASYIHFPYTTLFRSYKVNANNSSRGAHTMQILSGHISPETAYVVKDYPYGFRLRCQIRYWLEYKPSKGDRKSTRLNSSHRCISYAVFCLKKKNN